VTTGDFNWAWNGSSWLLGPGDPPWTALGQSIWHPNGTNNTHNQWAIRRWQSEVNGSALVRLTFGKSGSGGNGTTLRVFVNGVQQYTRTVAGTETGGFNSALILSGLDSGDIVEFALDSLGTDGQSGDGSDGSFFTCTVEQSP
jgi:hypothetical protein